MAAVALGGVAHSQVPIQLPISQLAVPNHLRAHLAEPVRFTPTGPDSNYLITIAELDRMVQGVASFGDTDHDGLNEIHHTGTNDLGECAYQILEHKGDNAYERVYSGPCLLPYAVGDLDADGKDEVMGHAGSHLVVYEAPDQDSHPTKLTWTSPRLTNVIGHPTIADSDRDGRLEIIHSVAALGGDATLVIFENNGNNSFELVFSAPVAHGGDGEKLIADLDNDGFMEITFAGITPRVYVFESTADNVWELTWSEWTFMSNAFAIAGGQDTDGNGNPEFFLVGNSSCDSVNVSVTTLVYEAVSDNEYEVVATLCQHRGSVGAFYNSTGNLDGAGTAEYVMQVRRALWIFSAQSEGDWKLVGVVDAARGGGVYAHDLNRNGVDEVVWGGVSQTGSLILEHPARGADGLAQGNTSRGLLVAHPNPFSRSTRLFFDPQNAEAAQLSVYTVAGRRVDRRSTFPGSNGILTWSADGFARGVYFLHLEDRSGQVIGSCRAVVLK